MSFCAVGALGSTVSLQAGEMAKKKEKSTANMYLKAANSSSPFRGEKSKSKIIPGCSLCLF